MQKTPYENFRNINIGSEINMEDETDQADNEFWAVSNPSAAAVSKGFFDDDDDGGSASKQLARLQKRFELDESNTTTDEKGENLETIEWSGASVSVSGSSSNTVKFQAVRSTMDSLSSSSQINATMNYITPPRLTTSHQKSPSVGSIGATSTISSSSVSIDNAIRSNIPKKEYSQADYARLDGEYKRLTKKFEQLNRERCRPAEVQDTIDRMITGKPFILEYHRKFDDKVKLLDAVLEFGDGDLILTVLLFLKTSLNYALFQEQLLQKPLAANHYVAYLRDHCKFEDLITTLFALGRKEEAAMVEFQLACKKTDPTAKISSLKRYIQSTLSADPNLSNECDLVMEYVGLLERQQPIDASDDKAMREGRDPKFKQFPKTTTLVDQSVLTTLYYCCLYHYELPQNSFASPLSVREHHKLMDKQFSWIAVRALSRQKRWIDIQHLLTSKSFFGGSKIKSSIPVEKLLVVLSNSGASPETLSIYVRLIDDVNRKLELAMKYKCHEVVVDCFVAAKDRVKLIEYGAKLTSHTKEAYYCEAALQNSANKWKN